MIGDEEIERLKMRIAAFKPVNINTGANDDVEKTQLCGVVWRSTSLWKFVICSIVFVHQGISQ